MENTMEITTDYKNDLITEKLAYAINYPEYRKLVAELASKGLSTSPVQTAPNTDYTVLNDARMRRLDKTIKIPEEVAFEFKNFKGKQTWLIITESWCGDAAQTMPVMNKLVEFSEGIDLKIIFRDTHPELMDAFLTNGTRSLPKLIVFDNSTKEVINEWGPRPSVATAMVNDFKNENGVLTPEFKQELQVWYNKDKGQTTITDLLNFIE